MPTIGERLKAARNYLPPKEIKPRGRPRAVEACSAMLVSRVRPSELEHVRTEAQAAGMTVSAYVRACLIPGAVD